MTTAARAHRTTFQPWKLIVHKKCALSCACPLVATGILAPHLYAAPSLLSKNWSCLFDLALPWHVGPTRCNHSAYSRGHKLSSAIADQDTLIPNNEHT